MARLSLYELLDLTDKASPDDIRVAYMAACAALAGQPESEDKRNKLSFLKHAHDTLLDRKKRALHDRENWTRAAPSPASSTASGRQKYRLLWATLVCAGVVLAWRGLMPIAAPPQTPASGIAVTAGMPPRAAAPENLPKLADIEALLPEHEVVEPIAAIPEAVVAPKNIVPPSTVPPEPMPVNFMVQNTAIFDKIIGSTFAVVGTQGMGTGVMIDKDRLLTNCHVLAPNVLKGKIYAISAKTRERFEITEAAFLVKDDACVALAPGLSGQAISVGETKSLRAGARFHNLGFAGGKLTLSEGQYVGNVVRSQQSYMVSTNFCAPGVSGGALVDDEGQLLGLTSGGTSDRRYCLSLTSETARLVLSQTMMQIDAFPTNYLTNFKRRW